jgi:hypothetical protein
LIIGGFCGRFFLLRQALSLCTKAQIFGLLYSLQFNEFCQQAFRSPFRHGQIQNRIHYNSRWWFAQLISLIALMQPATQML